MNCVSAWGIAYQNCEMRFKRELRGKATPTRLCNAIPICNAIRVVCNVFPSPNCGLPLACTIEQFLCTMLGMAINWVNADKPHLWKSDIAASVDQFNQWFLQFAPGAFRSTRAKTTEQVKAALIATSDLHNIDAATLKAKPGSLSTLRMCTAPPLAVDRLIGLAGASKNLVGRMEDGILPTRLKDTILESELSKLCQILGKLLDRDIFPWLDAAKDPTDHERDRASTIVADRLCSAISNPIVRNAQEQRQLRSLEIG